MSWTLETFAAACRQALTEDPGPSGRKKVCEIVQQVLKDDAFIAKHVGDDVPERKILYEDPTLGFCILAHAYQGKKTLLNRAQPPGGREISVALPTGADVVQIKCDVHPWMLAHVVMSPSPYFAVTGADGRFQIEGVPVGTWKVEAWHEAFGLKTGQLKVEEGKPATLTFSFP